jgi:hypothetical protein
LTEAGITSSNSFFQESENSEKCLIKKKIKQEFNFEDPMIKSNICYGFLNKKKKEDMLFNIIDNNQKRWFFLISSRPLMDKEYEANDNILESSALPYWIKFDTLYYYTFKDDEDDSEAKGEIHIK